VRITLEQLAAAVPGAGAKRCAEVYPHLATALEEFGVDTPLRVAAFLAQVGHESGDFRYMQEIASGKAYDGRSDLGNTRPEALRIAAEHGTTPGPFWKGHGPIQTTGYDNHLEVGAALGIDAVNDPLLLASLEHGFRAAGHFWRTRHLNEYADRRLDLVELRRTIGGKAVSTTVPAFDAISFRVNGGWNGRDERRRRYEVALKALVR
jgi:putative chitinase